MMAESGSGRHPLLVIFIGLGFLAMLVASLVQRFSQPDLTIQRFSGQHVENTPMEMSGIGQLMREAAAHPDNQEVLLRLVESLLALGEWQSAENFAQKALALDAEGKPNSRALYLLALAHHNKGEHEQAAELLEKLLEGDDLPSARYSLAILNLYYLNHPDAGLIQLRKGLENPDLSPGLREAMNSELAKFSENPAGKSSR